MLPCRSWNLYVVCNLCTKSSFDTVVAYGSQKHHCYPPIQSCCYSAKCLMPPHSKCGCRSDGQICTCLGSNRKCCNHDTNGIELNFPPWVVVGSSIWPNTHTLVTNNRHHCMHPKWSVYLHKSPRDTTQCNPCSTCTKSYHLRRSTHGQQRDNYTIASWLGQQNDTGGASVQSKDGDKGFHTSWGKLGQYLATLAEDSTYTWVMSGDRENSGLGHWPQTLHDFPFSHFLQNSTVYEKLLLLL